jgi:hypothetical protein
LFRYRLVTSSAVLAILGSAIAIVPATPAAAAGGTRLISAAGVTSIRGTSLGADVLSKNEIRGGAGEAGGLAPAGPNPPAAGSADRSASKQNGDQASSGERDTSAHGGSVLNLIRSFDGLNHRQQRLANGTNQFSLEPPDQGLCVGNGFVMEIINDVTRVYDASGNPLSGVTDLNTFFGYPAAFQRPAGPFGQFVTDPSCLFDKATQRWYADVLTIEVFPDTGNFTGQNHLDLAVSNGPSPLGLWTVYRTDVTDDGTFGTPNHGCTTGPARQTPTHPNACLGDYPHLGADANGIYLTTNEYAFFGPEFHGAQVYAYSKRALAQHAATVDVTQIDTHGMDRGNSGFTLWPAVATGQQQNAQGGTEYFLSSNAADEAHGNGTAVGPRTSNQLLVWRLTNTRSLNGDEPELDLSHGYLRVGRYSTPPPSEQKVGSVPLVDCLNNTDCSTFLTGIPDPFVESESPLDSNDTRMQQVTYANGVLTGALDTALVDANGHTKAGIEWFVVRPNGEDGARLVSQGYFGVTNNNVTYPAITMNANGRGVMAFTLVGNNHYPSAAFTSFSASGTGPLQVAAEGVGPANGFSGTFFYNFPNPPRPRWGDYGAAVVDGNSFWIASEYIGQTCTLAQYEGAAFGGTGAFGSCGGTRTSLANWDTRISHISAGDGGGGDGGGGNN